MRKSNFAGMPAILFLFFLFIVPFSSAFSIVDYEQFNYAGNMSVLQSKGWFNITGNALQTCAVSGDYIQCVPSVTANYKMSHEFNLVNSSYCISETYGYNGGARNFSIRGSVRASSLASYSDALNNFFRLTWCQGSVSCGDYYNAYEWNISANIENYAFDTIKDFTLFSIPKDLSYHTFQMDFITENSSQKSKIMFVNITSDLIYNNYSSNDFPNQFNCINVTQFYFDSAFVFDNLTVIVYDINESFISPSASFTAPYVANVMPSFTIVPRDKYGIQTLNVLPTISCLGGNVLLDQYCNPLYFKISDVSDPDSDTISLKYAQSCDNEYFFKYHDKLNGTDADIRSRYLLCQNSSFEYIGSERFIKLGMPANCSIITSYFYQDGQFSNMLSNQDNWLLNFDGKLIRNNRYKIEFLDANLNKVVNLDLFYNSSTNRLDIYLDNAIFTEITGFNPDLIFNFKVIFEKSGTYTLRLDNGNNKVFISNPISFDFSVPIYSLLIYALDNSSFNFNGAGELFGNISVRSIILPAFVTYSASQPANNCSSSLSDSFFNYVFMTDPEHPNNYINYKEDVWNTAYSANVAGTIALDAETQDFLTQMTGGNKILGYIFVMMVILGVVVLTAVGLAKGGIEGSSIFVISFIAGIFAMFIMSFIGLLPIFIPIIMIIIIALAMVYILKQPFDSGG